MCRKGLGPGEVAMEPWSIACIALRNSRSDWQCPLSRIADEAPLWRRQRAGAAEKNRRWWRSKRELWVLIGTIMAE
jgi:hypothetical protein